MALIVLLPLAWSGSEVTYVAPGAPPASVQAIVATVGAAESQEPDGATSSSISPPADAAGRPSAARGVVKPLPSCRSYYRRQSTARFVIHRFLWLKHSIEILALSAFVPVLSKLYCDKAAANAATSRRIVFLDIGANDGEDVWYWYKAFGDASSDCAGQTAFVLFEPQAHYQPVLRKIIGGRNDTLLVHAAVGKDEQHGTSLVMKGANQQGRVELDSGNRAAGQGDTLVPVKSLRLTLTEAQLWTAPIAVMKVDCEGADPTILVSSRPLFQNHRVELLIFEVNSKVRHFGIRYYDAAAMLEACGYSMFFVGLRSGPKENGFYMLEVNAKQFGLWRPNLETAIAVSPSLAKAMRANGGTFHFAGIGGRLLSGPSAASDAALDFDAVRPPHPSCIVDAYALPCPMCRQPGAKTT